MNNWLQKYSITEIFYLCYCVVRSKTISSNIRLIRFPIQIRNRSRIQFGDNFTSGVGCRLEVEQGFKNRINLKIGNNVQINDCVQITAAESVIIGNNVLIASNVYISDVAHGEYQSGQPSSPFEIPAHRKLVASPVYIEDNVWLGFGVCVLPGVTIGYGSIVGANSVVNKDVPPLSICVGIPAKVIKRFNRDTSLWETVNENWHA